MQKQYDVVILGGGLAGLTLSIQLKRSNPDISILILEKREGEAPEAAHKVGESTVELASHYFRNVLGMKDYLETHELPKHGLRAFFKSNNKNDITTRVELGPRRKLVVPSHQIDRGTFENYMIKHVQELGVTFLSGAVVKDLSLTKEGNTVTYKLNGEEHTVSGKWVVDAASRASIIKRKLGFQKELDHNINSVWWRVKSVVDVDTWTDNEVWKSKLEPKLRYLSTVHFMDKGYWIWVIPLGTGCTSIGIVADQDIHPLTSFNTYEKAMAWLKVNEPQVYSKLEPETPKVLDFMQLKHFAHNTTRMFSADERWGLTGEAGAFLDPLYSPGSDFIALANTWLADLILRDVKGEDISVRAKVYEQAFLRQVDNWIPIYKNKYPLLENSQIMVIKIFWDWAVYWSIHSLMFTNNGFVNLRLLKRLFGTENGLGDKLATLNMRMQNMFVAWKSYQTEVFENRYIDPFDIRFMRAFQLGLEKVHETDQLLEAQLNENMGILEQMATCIFRLVSSQAKDTPVDMAINPYEFDLENVNPNITPDGAVTPAQNVVDDVSLLWFYEVNEMA